MYNSKGFKALGSAIISILIFSQTAMAAPKMIIYQNDAGQIVQANYLNALTNPPMRTALTAALTAVESANLPLFVTDDSGSVINYEAALGKNENYAAALTDPAVDALAPVATYQMNADGTLTAAVTTANVSTASELKTALANNSITTITFAASFTASPTITRPLTMNFGAYTLTGDLSFNYTGTGTSVLTGNDGNRITGNLTVNTPKASFENGVKVSGAVNVVNVEIGTWTESADGNTLIITDPDGASITVTGNPDSVIVMEGASGSLTLTVNPGATVTSITSYAPSNIVVAKGATVTNITAAVGASGSTIINNGTTGTVTANVSINLVANVAPTNTIAGVAVNVAVSGTNASSVVVAAPPVVSPPNNPPASATYTVTFDSQGGSAEAPISNVTNGATVTLPAAPTKVGFTFGGWFTNDTTFTNAFTAATVVTANETVYAKWTTISVTSSWNLVKGLMTSDLTINVSGLSGATQYEVWANGLAISTRISISGANNYFRTLSVAFQDMSLLTIKLFNASGDQVGQATLSGTATYGAGSGALNY